MTTQPGPLTYERRALRQALMRLFEPGQNLEMLCKYVPRLVNAAVNIAKFEDRRSTRNRPGEVDELRKALRDLMDEHTTNKEETQW